MLTATALGKKNLLLLGRLLLNHNPEIAQELLTTYGSSDISQGDLARIDHLFLLYCKARGIAPSDYTGALYKSSKVEERHLFIGVVLQSFCPQVFQQPTTSIVLTVGLVKKLSQVLEQKKSNVSVMIRKVIAWQRSYDAFAATIGMLTEQLKAEV